MRLPDWVKAQPPAIGGPAIGGLGAGVLELKKFLRKSGIHTVCEEARCPNKAACFSRSGAAFLIMGPVCTRNCGFCSVRSAMDSGGTGPVGSGPSGLGPLSGDEPERLAAAARAMGLRYVVITSVTRDDLEDGGAGHFADCIRAVKSGIPGARVEVLTPDFGGSRTALETVLSAGPDVFNHNVETVPGLYPAVRPQADYKRSLSVLGWASESGIPVKSGFMLGLGEKTEEVAAVMRDLRAGGCRMLTIGQYLRPSRRSLPVSEYVRPERFVELKTAALAMGFRSVASGPLVRSSMNAEEYYRDV
ncbi:MAG: lipoyl synthase [Nitrospiraceae bacterium]|nr:lipoyl synthase [Nitrospiraceae bacterium]